ncbi:MAG: hypothetical protein H6733_02310 [Alphaproteobacteria bacterium]|nr:hypothetical protein [Alphaproteobacteria bacterium]
MTQRSSRLARAALLGLAVGAAGGCTGGQVQFDGLRMYDVWPWGDALITATYRSSDTSLPYALRSEVSQDFETIDTDLRIYTITFYIQCFGNAGICLDEDEDGKRDADGDVAFTWKMSADSRRGVNFHAADDTTYDPAVMLADSRMVEAESVTTESGGVTFVGTFEAEEVCPAEQFWPDASIRPDCYKFVLDDGGADSLVGGTYWATNQIGLVTFSRDVDDGETWALKSWDAEAR